MSGEDLQRRARLAHSAYCAGMRSAPTFDQLDEKAQLLWRRFAAGVGKPTSSTSAEGRIDAGRTPRDARGRPRTLYADLPPRHQLRWRKALHALDDDLGP